MSVITVLCYPLQIKLIIIITIIIIIIIIIIIMIGQSDSTLQPTVTRNFGCRQICYHCLQHICWIKFFHSQISQYLYNFAFACFESKCLISFNIAIENLKINKQRKKPRIIISYIIEFSVFVIIENHFTYISKSIIFPQPSCVLDLQRISQFNCLKQIKVSY